MTGIYSIAFWDEKNGIIFGGDWNDKGMNKSNKAITKDGGKSWKLLADGVTPGYRSCVQYITEYQLIAVGSTGLSFSADKGKSWQEFDYQDFYTIRVVPNQPNAWLAGKGKLGKLTW